MRRNDDVLVLAYHGVSERPGPLDVHVDAFAWQLRSLLARGYRAMTFHDAVTAAHRGLRLAVTFDDAPFEVFDHAAPVLHGLGIPGTVFVPVGYVDAGRAITWDGLRELAAAGWEVGSHGLTHRRLTDLGDDSLRDELTGSRVRLGREFGRPCRSVAYPFGLFDARVVRAAAEAGYRAGATTTGALAAATALTHPRVGVSPLDGPFWFRLKTSRTGRRARETPAARPLAAAARRMRRPQAGRSQA